MEKAMFAAGCFWGVEETFRNTPGVISTAVGYSGGNFINPTYEIVCGGNTGHAEAVEVEFDPQKVSFDHLVDLFFSSHDPTSVNRQGPDIGEQYRSAIFYFNAEQEAKAKAIKEKLDTSGKFKKPIATQIIPASTFYKAEEYHQQYLAKRGSKVCHT